jgi:acylphosphatase
MPTKYLLIKGRVQGVYYRASAKDVARKTGLTGWIRNTPDGHVEAMATGSEEQLELFINWCREGPRGARVTEVEIQVVDDAQFEAFKIV